MDKLLVTNKAGDPDHAPPQKAPHYPVAPFVVPIDVYPIVSDALDGGVADILNKADHNINLDSNITQDVILANPVDANVATVQSIDLAITDPSLVMV